MRKMQTWLSERRARTKGRWPGVVGLAAVIVLALPTPGAAVPDASAIEDRAIRGAVENEYLHDDAVPFHTVDVAVATGVVTLGGSVDTILARRRALELAQTIKGVRSVIDKLEVKPIGRSDDELKRDVQWAMLTDPAADSYEVEVSVEEAVATLRGTVDSWQEKQLVGRVAEGVKGLKEVHNLVVFAPSDDRYDPEITAEVRKRLKWDAWVDDGLITVSVDDGKVTLSGAVGSAMERARAMSDAWVPGVSDVDAADLEVKWWARDEMRRDKYALKTDEQIRRAVEDAFLYDPRVDSAHAEVEVDDGVVTLSGVVDNLQARRAAEEDARNTVGAFVVRNHLRVRPTPVLSDDEITQRVQRALQRDSLVDRFDVGVTTLRGEVFLAGEVDTWLEKLRAENAAAGVAGVLDIDNNLRVEPPPGYVSDHHVEAEIEDQLYWSPFVDSDEIHVSVDNRVATLTGTVDTWADHSWATKNAHEGGAQHVRNQLKVRNDQGAFWMPLWMPF